MTLTRSLIISRNLIHHRLLIKSIFHYRIVIWIISYKIFLSYTHLSYTLQILFNLSISHFQLPNMWKLANVCPIFKKGIGLIYPMFVPSPSFVTSVRISPAQHGFMKGHSVITNVVCLTQFLVYAMDNNLQTDICTYSPILVRP